MAYLRVVAGFFGYLLLIGAIDFLLHTEFGTAIVSALMGLGLCWWALARPLRERRDQRRARDDELIARADAGHMAFLKNDPAAFAPPPVMQELPRMRRGLKVAIVAASGLALISTWVAFLENPEREVVSIQPAATLPAWVAGHGEG